MSSLNCMSAFLTLILVLFLFGECQAYSDYHTYGYDYWMSKVSDENNDECNGANHGTAGQFDLYVLSQSWSAEFCYSNSKLPGCEQPTKYMQVNLTMHGLWPTYSAEVNGYGWPQCCNTTFPLNLTEQVISPYLSTMQLIWPNEADPSGKDLANSLWQHEWAKHGVCSGLAASTFIKSALATMQQPAVTTPSIISLNIGGKVSRDNLESWYNNGKPCSEDSCMVMLVCNDKKYLSEIRTCWSTNLTQESCNAFVQPSGDELCTSDDIYIASYI